MQFRVPQNITMEDRIVGPLTAIQFGISVIGGGIAFVVFSSTSIPSPINQMAGIGLAVLTVVLALGKYNGQPMYNFIKFIIVFLFTPKTRVWHKEKGEVKLVRPPAPKQEVAKTRIAKNVSREDIARLALVLDSRGSSGVVKPVTPTQNPVPSPISKENDEPK